MNAWLSKYWDRLRSSFWFIPSLMAAAAVALAVGATAVDRIVGTRWPDAVGWVYNGGAEGASLLLSTVAGSMITIAGVVFSMTLVSLSLTSSQLGPRLLRSFMRDTANQVVIGTFVATFVYCLLVLRTIRRADETIFVPHLAVSFGVLLALMSLAVLIYFIHHVAVSIQADEVIARVADDLFDGIDRMFPALIGDADAAEGMGPEKAPAARGRPPAHVFTPEDGYVQVVDASALIELAEQNDVCIRLTVRPGSYLVKGCTVAEVEPAERAEEALVGRVRTAFVLGNHRTATQDIEFSILQLVEIAVRALSPGVNDPFTAITCVNRLGSALCRLAQRDAPSPHRHGASGVLRLVAPVSGYAELVDVALNQIRQHARMDAAVTLRLLEVIETVAQHVRRPEDRAVLRRHAQMIVRSADGAFTEVLDRRALEQRFAAAQDALREPQVVPSHA